MGISGTKLEVPTIYIYKAYVRAKKIQGISPQNMAESDGGYTAMDQLRAGRAAPEVQGWGCDPARVDLDRFSMNLKFNPSCNLF